MSHLPETIKSIIAVYSAIEAVKVGKRFELALGPNEVMVVLAIDYNFHGTVAAGNNVIRWGLWRKTDALPAGSIHALAGSQDMIFSRISSAEFVTESLASSGDGFITLPWPLVLIRPPQLLYRTSDYATMSLMVRLWYVLHEVSNDELAKLMVKDHA